MHEWCDGRRSGDRRPRLYLAKGGEVVKFTGEGIAGYCAVLTAQYNKNGKWSATTYQLELSPGVRPLEFLSPLHGLWGDNLASWGEVATELGLPVEVAQQLVRGEYPTTAVRLDKVEAFALVAEAAGAETEIVIVSFGSPTNRQRAEGFWTSPKNGRTSSGATVTVRPGPEPAGWDAPEVVVPEGATIISSRHSPGMKGGYRTIEVLVPVTP